MSHAKDNILYRLVGHFPKDCEFIYTSTASNMLVPIFLKKMKAIGAQNLSYGYYSDDTYLLSKVLQKFVPGLKVCPFKLYESDLFQTSFYTPLSDLEDIGQDEIYEYLTPYTQEYWYYLKS